MKQTNKVIQTYGLWFTDMICIIVSYMLATWIRFGQRNDYGNVRLHYMVAVIFLLFCTVYSFFADWNRDFIIRGAFRELTEVLKFNAIMIVVGMSFVFFAQWAYILSRIVIFWFFIINFALMLTAHLLLKKILRRALSTDQLVSKVVLVAEKEVMRETILRLKSQMDVSCEIVAAVYADPSEDAEQPAQNIEGVQVYSGMKNLTDVMTTIPFDEVFINTPDISQKHLYDVINGFEEMGVVVHYSLELKDIGDAIAKADTFGDYTVITYTRFRSSYKRLMIKRLLDIVGGLIGLIITGILTVFIAPAIKLDSPGPVFFSQTRVGKNARRFKIYKFRSMYRDAEDRLRDLQAHNEMNGLMFKMENDPRITRVGAFLRKTSLDEFPQFLNVLKGDMSLVGTRPPTEAEFEQYNEHYRRRLSMTPGLTGLWQVSGRSSITDFDEVVRLDLEYIDSWSLTLDFKIILKTILVVFRGRGAE
jgi:exopolysaccharide biosynthesis polyprenyl glycosylphosphotransferase